MINLFLLVDSILYLFEISGGPIRKSLADMGIQETFQLLANKTNGLTTWFNNLSGLGYFYDLKPDRLADVPNPRLEYAIDFTIKCAQVASVTSMPLSSRY